MPFSPDKRISQTTIIQTLDVTRLLYAGFFCSLCQPLACFLSFLLLRFITNDFLHDVSTNAQIRKELVAEYVGWLEILNLRPCLSERNEMRKE